MLQKPQSHRIVKGSQTDLAQIADQVEFQLVLAHQIDKAAIITEVEEQTDLFKLKIVQVLTIDQADQFELDLQIEAGGKIDLVFLLEQLVVQIVLIIVQGFLRG